MKDKFISLNSFNNFSSSTIHFIMIVYVNKKVCGVYFNLSPHYCGE